MADIDKEWIFDSVVNFVKSPLWKVPVTSFINENCVIFDDEDENKLEYTDIHNKFKDLVEEMLTNMLSEIGISEEIFANACIKASSNPVHKMLLSEIMAVDNFMAFKKLMVKRNKALSEEALQLMQAQEAGIDPNLLYEQQNFGGAVSNEDDEIARAIKASLELEESKKSGNTPSDSMDDEDEMLKRVLAESKKEYEASQKRDEEDEKELPKPKTQKPKVEQPPVKPAESAPAMKAPKALAPIGSSKPTAVPMDSGFDIQKHAEETAKKHQINEAKKAEDIKKKADSKEDMKKRMENLRKQRDILLQKKQEQLQKEWEEFDDKGSSSTGDSRKDMIKKGLNALKISEGSKAYKTEQQKKQEMDEYKQEKMKKQENAKLAKMQKDRYVTYYYYHFYSHFLTFKIVNQNLRNLVQNQ